MKASIFLNSNAILIKLHLMQTFLHNLMVSNIDKYCYIITFFFEKILIVQSDAKIVQCDAKNSTSGA